MAIIKNVQLNTGVEATYWVLIRADVDVLGKQVHCLIGGYLSEAAYKAGRAPITERGCTCSFSGDILDDLCDVLEASVDTQDKVETVI